MRPCAKQLGYLGLQPRTLVLCPGQQCGEEQGSEHSCFNMADDADKDLADNKYSLYLLSSFVPAYPLLAVSFPTLTYCTFWSFQLYRQKLKPKEVWGHTSLVSSWAGARTQIYYPRVHPASLNLREVYSQLEAFPLTQCLSKWPSLWSPRNTGPLGWWGSLPAQGGISSRTCVGSYFQRPAGQSSRWGSLGITGSWGEGRQWGFGGSLSSPLPWAIHVRPAHVSHKSS